MAAETIEETAIPGDRLPADHPALHRGPVEGPSVWYGPELAKDDAWIYELSSSEKQEVLQALSNLRRLGLDIQNIRRRDFALPTFAPRLDALRQEVIRGRGFVL